MIQALSALCSSTRPSPSSWSSPKVVNSLLLDLRCEIIRAENLLPQPTNGTSSWSVCRPRLTEVSQVLMFSVKNSRRKVAKIRRTCREPENRTLQTKKIDSCRRTKWPI